MKPAVITPYHQETLEILERCHRSVCSQTAKVTHIHGGRWQQQGRHRSMGWPTSGSVATRPQELWKYTPGLGALMAASQGYEPIFFLDADNWFKPNHVELALELHHNDPSIDVVISRRNIVLDDGSILHEAPEDVEQLFADTSTLCLFKRAYRSLSLWTLMPNGLAPICDRVIYQCLKALPLKLHWHSEKTLMFESHYANHYQLAGKVPKTPVHDPNWEKLKADLPALLDEFQALTGIQLSCEL